MLKKSSAVFAILSILAIKVIAQEFHTPDEIYTIMEKSNLTYEISALENKLLPPDRSDKLLIHNFYREFENGQFVSYRYETDKKAEALLKKAEQHFQKLETSDARKFYLEVYQRDSSYHKVLTYIAQTYGMEQDYESAVLYYKKAIEANFIDYMAHWFLADIYKHQGKLDEAVEEITLAMVLNRNNPRIKASMAEIYNKSQLNAGTWTFHPQIKIDSVAKNTIKVEVDEVWLGYGLYKAVWQYEPGYKAAMGVEGFSYSMTEEKECLVSLALALEDETYQKLPVFKTLSTALDQEMLDAYVMYEILLPEYPEIALQLSEEAIFTIKDYVTNIRTTKIME